MPGTFATLAAALQQSNALKGRCRVLFGAKNLPSTTGGYPRIVLFPTTGRNVDPAKKTTLGDLDQTIAAHVWDKDEDAVLDLHQRLFQALEEQGAAGGLYWRRDPGTLEWDIEADTTTKGTALVVEFSVKLALERQEYGTGLVELVQVERDNDTDDDDFTIWPPYEDVALEDSPLLLWMCDDATGSTAQDATTHDRDGTYNGSPDLDATGLIIGVHKSASASADEAYIRRTTAPGIGASDPFTVEWWGTTTLISGVYNLIGDSPWVGGSGQFIQYQTGTGSIVYGFGADRIESSGSVVIVDTAQHFVITHDGAGALALYVNGTLAHSGTVGVPSSGWSGFFYGGNGGGGGLEWRGSVQAIALYSEQLSLERIQRHYAVGTHTS